MAHFSSDRLVSGVWLLAAALFSGCASTYDVKVHADARPQPEASPRHSFRIDDRSATAGPSALREREIAGHLRTALSAQGLFEAPEAVRPDIVVELTYGLGPPRVQRKVYQEIVNGRPMPAGQRVGPPPEGVAREMMGYVALAETTITREKHLSICARTNRADEDEGPAEDLWRVHVTIESESEDLRGHLPVLASVAMDHIGRSTEGALSVTLRSDSEAIRFVRKGM